MGEGLKDFWYEWLHAISKENTTSRVFYIGVTAVLIVLALISVASVVAFFVTKNAWLLAYAGGFVVFITGVLWFFYRYEGK